ncbi:gephyrin-like molybdotransferase Glp [Aquimarina sp. 2201CG5-10]|uniref:molybdopterin molybdotransferase MoeA n=1 Tax=Aquimarina callyspongiae TaxID=3098150 RepID=UPI002AB4F1D7|nr:gephyrin-like molybdotransferase Glp [Aquimarina sp. 2201CG5-10]MDY8138154.1 gephyrin-like molybdotransferase Glp [Aquimarina sp. 2201CG5-10]
MISVSEALSIVTNTPYSLQSKTVSIREANELILSSDIPSPIHMPPFRQSAMDGYALLLHKKDTYTVIGEVKAGDSEDFKLIPGQSVRIFTGAKVPDTADTIIIQENITRKDDIITINSTLNKGQNIRPLGEQIRKGDIALSKGTKLTPSGIGFLAGLGIKNVDVYIPPSVAIIVTGNELVTPGEKLNSGQIYESNSLQLEAVLSQLQIKTITKYVVEDEYQSTKDTIEQAIQNHNLVLISGGISVGDYDFVKEALSELKTEELFYKIKQKPGKPLFYGKNNSTLIFALPGNPASSLTCFYIYVLPIIQKMMGHKDIGLHRSHKTCITNFTKKGDRAQFLKAKISNETVEILEGQSSAMLHTFAIANALVYLPEDKNQVINGEMVETIYLSI